MADFDELYRQYADPVFRFALRQVTRREVAEEITADTFVALFERFDRIDLDQLPAWLFTVARNRARDYWRRQAVEFRFAADLAQPEAAAPPSSLARWLDEHADLKPAHRACLILRYAYGMERSEIAAATGMTEMQVKSALQYGLRLLRRQIVPAQKR